MASVKLTENQKAELLVLFPDEAAGLIERSDYDEIIDFLYDESIAAFDINDDPTEKSNRIERLMDAINWGVFHPEDM